jgi:hypothetical protein
MSKIYRRSFLSGYLDLFGQNSGPRLHFSSIPCEIADAEALASDWRTVGNDLALAMRCVDKEHQKKHLNSNTNELKFYKNKER